MKNNKLFYQSYFGVSDFITKKDIDQHTMFNTGSISKSICCIRNLDIRKQGLLSTEDYILEYFPDFVIKEIV